jgi:hypothetical protein
MHQNQETDSLKITQNSDGSYEINWDKEDPNWSWMNNLTSNEIQIIVQQAVQDKLNRINENDAQLPKGMEHDERT